MLRCASTQEGVRFKDLETTEVWKFLNKHIRESKGVLQPNRGWKIPLGQGTGEHQWLELSRASKTAYKLLNHFKPSVVPTSRWRFWRQSNMASQLTFCLRGGRMLPRGVKCRKSQFSSHLRSTGGLATDQCEANYRSSPCCRNAVGFVRDASTYHPGLQK